MKKFVPYEKRSKRSRRDEDKKGRRSWGNISPITRKPKNPKAYDRRKARQIIDNR